MTNITRRKLIQVGGAAAATLTAAAVAVVPTGITGAPRRVSVQTIIADIRALPSSTPHLVKRVLQTTADFIEEFAGKGIARPRADLERPGGAS